MVHYSQYFCASWMSLFAPSGNVSGLVVGGGGGRGAAGRRLKVEANILWLGGFDAPFLSHWGTSGSSDIKLLYLVI